jgi:hypothetical protein
MAFRNKVRPGEWVPGSARVEANLESDHPTWVLTVAQGPRNRRLDIAAGPISTRRLGDRIGQLLNNMDVAEWYRFINRALHEVLDGAWG